MARGRDLEYNKDIYDTIYIYYSFSEVRNLRSITI